MKEIKPDKGLNDVEQPSILEDTGPTAPNDEMFEILEGIAESNSIMAVTLLRIYDVLMCQYAESDLDDALKLIAEHKAGKIRGEIPYLDLRPESEK